MNTDTLYDQKHVDTPTNSRKCLIKPNPLLAQVYNKHRVTQYATTNINGRMDGCTDEISDFPAGTITGCH